MNANTNFEVSGTVITVCAWCYPGETIYDRLPVLRDMGLQINHTICKACADRWKLRAQAYKEKPAGETMKETPAGNAPALVVQG